MIESYLDQEEQIKEKQKLKRNIDTRRKHTEEAKMKLDLHRLQELVEQGVVDTQLVEQIKKEANISQADVSDIMKSLDVQKIFEKIEEIEQQKDIDKILPKAMRVTKEEYLQALKDPTKKAQVLQKFDQCLTIIYTNVRPSGLFKRSVFGAFVYILDKKLLCTIQEHIIDMKNTLAA